MTTSKTSNATEMMATMARETLEQGLKKCTTDAETQTYIRGFKDCYELMLKWAEDDIR